jgi:acyl-CoA thioester hydrolase
MVSFKSQLRVRYGETDQMGYVYYGNYALYLEVGRVELMRSLGISYRWMEENGIMMPVANMEMKYHLPANYDDLLTINTLIADLPTARISFTYHITNEEDKLIVSAKTDLVFIHAQSKKIMKAPLELMQKLEPHF